MPRNLRNRFDLRIISSCFRDLAAVANLSVHRQVCAVCVCMCVCVCLCRSGHSFRVLAKLTMIFSKSNLRASSKCKSFSRPLQFLPLRCSTAGNESFLLFSNLPNLSAPQNEHTTRKSEYYATTSTLRPNVEIRKYHSISALFPICLLIST